MKAKEIREQMQKEGTWVDWEHTNDQFITGNPESEVTGIAVSWMSTFSNLQKALDAEINLFVTHEALYAVEVDESGRVIESSLRKNPQMLGVVRGYSARYSGKGALILDKNDAWVRKKKWLDETGMIVYRCHDFWDNYPEIGIHGAWAKWLGLTGKPIAEKKDYEVHEVGNITFGELAENILRRVKPLGQDVIQVIGDPDRKVHRIAVGTGASTEYREMYGMGADVLVLTEDAVFQIAESGQWSLDSDIPFIVVNHATSEEPGMRTLAKYIQEKFPETPVKEFPVGCMYRNLK